MPATEAKCNDFNGLDEELLEMVPKPVHGQLHDVLFLLNDAGLPYVDRFFVFNGDYVD